MARARLMLLSVFILIQFPVFGGGRLPVRAKYGMVVSSSKYASEIGMQVLKNGGNAIDAAVATAFALAVTLPSAGNIGGGGFLVYYGADGKITTIDFREKAPLAATANMYLDASGNIHENSNHEGILSTGVPGTVAGLVLAHKKFGKLGWRQLVKPALMLAKIGIPLTWGLYDDFKLLKENWLKYPSSAKVFLKADGSLYEPGDLWIQRDLAATLERIMNEGRDGFYKGETAKYIVEFMQKNNGLITQNDLDQYEAIERVPVHGTFRGYDIYSMAPPSSGGVTIVEMLNILEGYDLREMGHNSAQYLHLLTETMRRAFADRAQFLGDPEFNPDMPIKKIISKEHAARLSGSISLTEASVSDSTNFNNNYESPETTHLSVVDSMGNMVSLTYTLDYYYGNQMVVEGAGFLLNNEMGDFNPIPGTTDSHGNIGTKPNLIQPQKRMLSSMSPTIVAKDGKAMLVLGSPGGRSIINTVLQVLLNVIEFKMNIAEAIESPRIHHQWLPDKTVIEDWGFSPDTERIYKEYGHAINYENYFGRCMGIYKDPETGLLYGAADSRSTDGAAVGY
ncbi:MAG: gamma-glutamyltransferase [Melioribacteraceae bacterium]|nr:gamma-glutamyltransferase [Melioribacteraceae bacterium]MCF8354079.1 gamma-glutamyltransferase [Melioribacteraceae bacterium]MCF8393751.1 gamma-glutamyltransferase [Melioribacteraceae bacterium]MCF8419495.1 gamma-glutamyltransferase [Melioribacteraceae bacterium]